MIEWQILQLKEYGINEFVLIIGHLGEKIEDLQLFDKTAFVQSLLG